jgi:nicotinamide phosphoribosyltransferase
VSYESLKVILQAMQDKGWAAGNVAFGSGGALLQKLNRDTQKCAPHRTPPTPPPPLRCAFKCCEAIVGGEARHVFKDPITDKGKAPKKGSNPHLDPDPYPNPNPDPNP